MTTDARSSGETTTPVCGEVYPWAADFEEALRAILRAVRGLAGAFPRPGCSDAAVSY